MEPTPVNDNAGAPAPPTPVRLDADAVVVMQTTPSRPLMLALDQTGTERAILFGSSELSAALLARMDLGFDISLAPAQAALQAHPECFTVGEVVFFADKVAINRFANEPDYLPIVTLFT